MATVMKKSPFSIKRVWMKTGGWKYQTYRLEGKLNGVRIRKNYRDKQEAIGEKQRLEVAAANTEGASVAKVTPLSTDQLREAEAAYHNLSGQSLSLAVAFFKKNYREPKTDLTIAEVVELFLVAKKESLKNLSSLTLGNYKLDLRDFCAEFGKMKPHEVTSTDIHRFLESRKFPVVGSDGKQVMQKIGVKRWNNFRGNLNHFFNWCNMPPRNWVPINPVTSVEKFDWERGTPTVIPLKQCIQLMQFAVAYKGGAMVPYFALALFAGIRPAVTDGEIIKIARLPKDVLKKVIDLDLGVIRLTKELTKVKSPRTIRIQPNLMAWLEAYPLNKYPLAPSNFVLMVSAIREHCGLKGLDDVLRHVFISMYVAKFKSVGEAALQAGNSEQVIKKHYLDFFTEADAKLFWGITPVSILEHSETAEAVRRLIEAIEIKKKSGAKEITADELYEWMEEEAWGKALMEDTLYRRHERDGWRIS